MAAIGISEFTFGYAFLYEQTRQNWANLTACPVLPSLQKEKDEGWDARLPTNGTTFFFQFKLAEHLSRSNARYIADGTYTSAYYRVALHRKDANNQHRCLRSLCQVYPETYYVAPQISDITTFNSAFLNGEISANTRWIRVQDAPDINDGDQHYFTFQDGDLSFMTRSLRHPVGRSYSGRDAERLFRNSHTRWLRIDDTFAERLFGSVSTVVRELPSTARVRPLLPLLDFDPRGLPRGPVLSRVSQILATFFGVTLVVVGDAPVTTATPP